MRPITLGWTSFILPFGNLSRILRDLHLNASGFLRRIDIVGHMLLSGCAKIESFHYRQDFIFWTCDRL